MRSGLISLLLLMLINLALPLVGNPNQYANKINQFSKLVQPLVPTSYAICVVDGETGDQDSVDACDDAGGEWVDSLDDQAQSEIDTCYAGGFSLGWIMCPIIEGFTGVLNFVETQVVDSLENDPKGIEGLQNSWIIFRDISAGGMVLVIVFMILSSVLKPAGDAGKSYNLKRTVPRLFIAFIGIYLSFMISSLILDIGNIMGEIIKTVMKELPGFDGGEVRLLDYSGAGTGLLRSAIDAVVLGFGVYFLVTGMLGAAAIGVLFLFFTVAIRKILVVLLVLFSPIAFLLFVLPQTNGIYKKWFENLWRLSLMYPMVIAIIYGSEYVSFIIAQQNDNKGAVTDLSAYIGFIVKIAPLFIIPATFKMAGSLLSFAGGKLNNLQNKGTGVVNKAIKDTVSQPTKELIQRKAVGIVDNREEGNSRRLRFKRKAARLAFGPGAVFREGGNLNYSKQRQAVLAKNEELEKADQDLFADQWNLGKEERDALKNALANGRSYNVERDGKIVDTKEPASSKSRIYFNQRKNSTIHGVKNSDLRAVEELHIKKTIFGDSGDHKEERFRAAMEVLYKDNPRLVQSEIDKYFSEGTLNAAGIEEARTSAVLLNYVIANEGKSIKDKAAFIVKPPSSLKPEEIATQQAASIELMTRGHILDESGRKIMPNSNDVRAALDDPQLAQFFTAKTRAMWEDFLATNPPTNTRPSASTSNSGAKPTPGSSAPGSATRSGTTNAAANRSGTQGTTASPVNIPVPPSVYASLDVNQKILQGDSGLSDAVRQIPSMPQRVSTVIGTAQSINNDTLRRNANGSNLSREIARQADAAMSSRNISGISQMNEQQFVAQHGADFDTPAEAQTAYRQLDAIIKTMDISRDQTTGEIISAEFRVP